MTARAIRRRRRASPARLNSNRQCTEDSDEKGTRSRRDAGALFGSAIAAQTPPAPQAEIPGVIRAGAQVQLVKDGLNGLEGPVPSGDGGLYFTAIDENRIYKVDRDGKHAFPSGARTPTARTGCSCSRTGVSSAPKAAASGSSRLRRAGRSPASPPRPAEGRCARRTISSPTAKAASISPIPRRVRRRMSLRWSPATFTTCAPTARFC